MIYNFVRRLRARGITRVFVEQNVHTIVFLNGHYENYQFLYEGVDAALREKGLTDDDDQSVLLLSYWDYVSEDTLAAVSPNGFPGGDIEHGGVLETSLMQYLYPKLVRMDRAVSQAPADLPRFDRLPMLSYRTRATGCLSGPDGSSAEKGQLLVDQVTDAIAGDLVAEAELA